MPDDTIYKHPFGALIRGLIGTLAIGIVYVAGDSLELTDPFRWLVAFILLVIGVSTVVTLIVYYLSHINVNATGIEFISYSALFTSYSTDTEWTNVQTVTVSQSGIFSVLLRYGELTVQTSDARPNMTMTYVPNANALKARIEQAAQTK